MKLNKKSVVAVLLASFSMLLTSCTPDSPGPGPGPVIPVDPPIVEKDPTAINIIGGSAFSIEVEKTLLLSVEYVPADAKKVSITWSSEASTVAHVDEETGLVTGISQGTARIQAKTEEGLKSIATFTVTPKTITPEPPKPVKLTKINISGPDKHYVELGKTIKVGPIFTPSNAKAENVIWSVADESVITFNVEDGLITPHKVGETTIHLETVDGTLSDTHTVYVTTPPDPYTLSDMKKDVNGNYLFDFLAINDTHGALAYNPDLMSGSTPAPEPGINRLATGLKTIRNENPAASVLISSGDMWQGSADSNITRGSLIQSIMNELDFDSMTLGNHEFDWLSDTILENKGYSEFPFLAANIKDKAESARQGVTVYDRELADPYKIVVNEATGIRIGIIGAIGEGITSSIVASAVKNYEFVDPLPLLRDYSNMLRTQEGCDIIIFTYHHGISALQNQFAAYADAIFIAHDHATINETITYNGRTVPVIESASNGKLIGNIELAVNPTTKAIKISQTRNVNVFNAGYAEDPRTKEIYDYYLREYIDDIKNEVLGNATSNISTNSILNFTLSQMLRKYNELDSKVIAVVHNSGGVRSAIPAGVITYGSVYKSLPFDNNLYIVNYGTNSSAVSYLLNSGTVQYISGFNSSSLSSGQGYKVVTISYCFEKYSAYETLDFEILPDYPRDIVADALRSGQKF